MVQMHPDSRAACQMLRELLGAVRRAVLAAGATERHLQMRESPADETLHMSVDEREYVSQESDDLAVLLQEILHLPVEAGHGAETLVFAGVVNGTAVEYIASAVAGQVFGDSLLVREAVDMDMQQSVWLLRQPGAGPYKFFQDSR